MTIPVSASEPLVLNIEAQRTDQALLALAEQSGYQIIFARGIAERHRSGAVQGEYELEAALRMLLAGTGLSFDLASDRMIVIQPEAGSPTGSGYEDASLLTEEEATVQSIKQSRSFIQRLSAALAIAFTANAVAQDDASEAMVMEEVVVTATKRETALSDTPFSIQAFTSESLERANIRDLSELITFVPGASEGVSNTIGQRAYQIRGISAGAGDQTVGYYLDDSAFFVLGWLFSPIGRSFDMERVEVLRGPQSTLYGNGNMGGTIRYISNAPNLTEFEAHARAGWSDTKGGDAGYYVDAAISMPIVEDTLALRVVGGYEKVGGYQEDFLGNENVGDGKLKQLRANLLWTPTDRLRFRFKFAKNQIDQDGGTLLASTHPPVTLSLPNDFNDLEYDLLAGTIEYDFDFATLTSTFTGIDLDNKSLFNLPFAGAPNDNLELDIALTGDSFNNETRLVSNNDGPMQWLLGMFYSDSELDTFQGSNFPALIPDSTSTSTSEIISFFGEVSWDLMDGQLVPLVGLRYFEDERDVGVSNSPDALLRDTFKSTNPRFNLSWFPTDTSTYYLNIAKGFRSGSFNDPFFCEGLHGAVGGLPCDISVDSDKLWSYEVGTKQTMADGQVVLDIAVYLQDWQNVRQGVSFFGINQTYQVGDAQVPGIDLQLNFAPAAVEGLLLSLSANWNAAEWDEVDPTLSAVTGVVKGDRMPYAPEWTLAASASYGWTVSDNWKGQGFVGFSHIEPQNAFGQPPLGERRDLLRARFGFHTDRYGIFLFGNNLLNENNPIFSTMPVGRGSTFTQDYPRQIGVELTYDFN